MKWFKYGMSLALLLVLAMLSSEEANANGTIPPNLTCTIATTVEANSVNYAVSCTQPGWYNLKFGDGGNTHIESGTNKPHSFSCLDNLVQYSYVLETLDGQKLTEGSVNAGCSNEGQQPQPDLTHKLYCPLITR